MKSFGILGGSFDPAHNGHLQISKIALKKLKLSKVFWVVTKKNPFKKKPFITLAQRVNLAKKLSKNVKKIEVIYLDSVLKSSRTIILLKYFLTVKKYKNIYFIIGSDNLSKLHKWKSWKKIVNLAKLVVFSRKGYDRVSKKSIVAKYLKKKIIFIKNKHIIISSTKLRESMK